MIKLLRADLARMFKTLSFWLCGACSTAFIVWYFLLEYSSHPSWARQLGAFAFGTMPEVSLLFFASVFAALFVGTDYLEGTIRNKISIGHSRASIYFSNLITCSIGSFFHCVMCWAALFVVGLFTKGAVGFEPGEIVIRFVITMLAMISVCSMAIVIGMLTTSKSSSVVIIIVSSIAIIFGIAVVNGLSDAKILKIIGDALPYGSAFKIDYIDSEYNRIVLPFYSMVFTALISSAGTFIFCRKDIK